MSNTLPPVPYKTPVTNQSGLLNAIWDAWFRELFKRIGGNIAPSIIEINALTDGLETTVGNLETQVANLQAEVNGFTGIGIGRQL